MQGVFSYGFECEIRTLSPLQPEIIKGLALAGQYKIVFCGVVVCFGTFFVVMIRQFLWVSLNDWVSDLERECRPSESLYAILIYCACLLIAFRRPEYAMMNGLNGLGVALTENNVIG